MTEAFRPDLEGTVATAPKARPAEEAEPNLRQSRRTIATTSKALALAFDRNTCEPVPASALKTYAQAIAQYHLSPEPKFLNARHT